MVLHAKNIKDDMKMYIFDLTFKNKSNTIYISRNHTSWSAIHVIWYIVMKVHFFHQM